MIENEITSSGDMVILTQGEYSDYGFIGHYKANQTVVWKEQLDRYLEEFPSEKESYSATHEKFVSWLIEQGLLTEVKVQEVHIGSYGCWTN